VLLRVRRIFASASWIAAHVVLARQGSGPEITKLGQSLLDSTDAPSQLPDLSFVHTDSIAMLSVFVKKKNPRIRGSSHCSVVCALQLPGLIEKLLIKESPGVNSAVAFLQGGFGHDIRRVDAPEG
jgi:hypothetical protein